MSGMHLPGDHEDARLARQIAPRGRGLAGVALVAGGAFAVVGGIVWGGVEHPIDGSRLPEPAPFDLPVAASAPEALVSSPMVALPPGPFMMGSSDKNESPVHREKVAAFSIDVHEVTVRDYRACVEAGRCPVDELASLPGCNWGAEGHDAHPMNCVDYNEAESYCHWVGKRLPTEVEFEYAARGEEGRAFPWGAAAPTEATCCFKRTETCAVGARPAGATPQGVHDLAGNVWEWTSSIYCPYDNPGCDGAQRAVRGGSYTATDGAKVRATVRSGHVVTLRERYLGFRCAKSAGASPSGSR